MRGRLSPVNHSSRYCLDSAPAHGQSSWAGGRQGSPPIQTPALEEGPAGSGVDEYIGKEANRWEEQFHLGELPEANIQYGICDEDLSRAIDCVRAACDDLTQVTVAQEAGISRQQLSAILYGRSRPSLATLRALVRKGAATSAEQ